MSTINYKCPCCASALTYDGASGKLICGSCGNSFALEDMEAMDMAQEGANVTFDVSAESFSAADAQNMGAYNCKNCGAQLIAETTTTATECPYCGSPVILSDHIQGGVKPEKVVPFVVPKEKATQMFHEYFKGKKLLPNVFIKSANQIREMKKLYVPYWLFDCDASADIIYNAEKKSTHREGDYEVTKTEHWSVRRTGTLGFDSIPVDGSQKMDEKIAESLEPYDLTKAVPFQSAVLSGAMADHADIPAADCEGRAVERVKTSTERTMEDTVKGYTSVSVRKSNIQSTGGKATPVLLPVWMITTEKEQNGERKLYTFAINGQTGELTCDVPADKGKYWMWFFLVLVIALAVCFGGMALLDMLESGTMVIGGIVSLIIAFCVVSSMSAKLKTAAKQSAAMNYIRKNSLDLTCKRDTYLYTTTERRKIEKQEQKSA